MNLHAHCYNLLFGALAVQFVASVPSPLWVKAAFPTHSGGAMPRVLPAFGLI